MLFVFKEPYGRLLAMTNIENLHAPVGHHVLLDLFDCQCPSKRLSLEKEGKKILEKLSKLFHPLGVQTHQFQPFSYSGLVLLEESHISIHTWTELKFVSMDFYTCDGKIPDEAISIVIDYFRPLETNRQEYTRGKRPALTHSFA